MSQRLSPLDSAFATGWISRWQEAFLSPMFSEGRKPVNSCARAPRAEGLLADGWWPCFPGPELESHMGDKSVKPRVTVGLGARVPGLWCLQSCWRKAATENALGMGTPTRTSRWGYWFACKTCQPCFYTPWGGCVRIAVF